MILLSIMTMKKSRKIALIIASVAVGVMLIMGIIIGGFAFYFTSSKGYCSTYANEHEKKVAAPNDMTNHLFYSSCMESRGLRSFGV